ncbi:MAG TPA: hypothetical protein VGR88_02650 [Ktedonobacterales bacterium]|nr:hypothetical protein [Ktedonobacterales bacterium]
MGRGRWRVGSGRQASFALSALGGVFLAVGAALGWLVPRLPRQTLAIGGLRGTLAGSGLDAGGYLGADITALAVIIAVVIGFNATTLQIAGQTHSLVLVRAILLSLTPFILCWSAATSVALLYFLAPPVYVAQLWQMLCWFAAVVVLMFAYLWDLPWRLSGQYVGLWAIRGLARRPINQWESLDGFSALQTSISAASARGDLGTVRAVTAVLGPFLAETRDAKAEAENTYERGRYRALKNLLSGSAQNAALAPNAVSYSLGYVVAGVLLQSCAVGHLMDDGDHDLLSGLFRAFKDTPERISPLWTGTRHALCRTRDGDEAYLLRYWRSHRAWPADDPRRVTDVAEGLAWLHAGCRRELRANLAPAAAETEAVQLLLDLYRDIATHLAPLVAHQRAVRGPRRTPDLILNLLDSVHIATLRSWPDGEMESGRVTLVNAYEARRKELAALFGQQR